MINQGYVKDEEYILEEDKNFSKRSTWTAAESIEFTDGLDLESKIGTIKGTLGSVADYYTLQEPGYILDALSIKQLLNGIGEQIGELSNSITATTNKLPIALTLDQYNALPKSEKENGREYNIIG